MAIRKPSDYFNNENNSIEETIQDNAKNSELNTFSDAYNAFKRNLSKVDVLNNFSETLGNYQDNVEKVNYLSEKIDEIDKDIKNLLTKEDLDKALISQLLFLEECIRDVQEKVKGINHKNLTQVKLDISSLSETVNIFIDEEIPRYEKLVVESETRLTDKCEVLEEELKDTLDNIKDVIDEKYISDFKSLNEEIDKIKTNDIPKYKNLIVDSEIKTDSKIKEFAEVFDNTVNDIVSKIELVKEDNTEIFDTLNSKVNEVNQIHNLMLDDIEKSENTRDELDKKIVDLEVEILRNESHIESQNKNIEDIHGDVKSAIDRLNIGKIEENNFKLGEKIKYLEEVFEKFNEKELLSENIITEPSSTDNNDSLTPLDKNFVTLDQLQNHYRLFINRIQQQLASLGGGGEVRLEFLDDVDRDSAKVNGKFLKYDSASGKWVGANASGGAGSQTLDETLGLGNTSSLGMSVGVVTSTKLHIDPVGSGVTFNEDLVVVGDARVTGILSIGTSSIVLDPNSRTISGIEEVQLGESTIKHNTEGEIIFVNTINPTQTINVGIGSTASVNTTGIITASSFTGSLIGTATNATNLNNQAASYYLDYNNLSNKPTIPARTSDLVNDSGFVTSSVVVGYATEGFVNSAVAGIVSSAPATLDTLNELAQALGDDANFSTTVTNLIGTKASLSGATFTGIVTAPSFSGDGSSLTNIDAVTLDGLDSTQFLRSDQGDITTGNITISNTQPTLVLEDTDGVDEFAVINAGGTFIIRNQTDARNDFSVGGGGAINANGILRANAALNVTGNITVSGTVDGRDLATDGTKLDGIASFATAYGDSDVDSHLNRTQSVSQNYVLSWDGQDYAWVAQSGGGGGGISNVVEDTTPQLGGNLDLNSNLINGTGGINITGILTATTFSGSGASLTAVDAATLDGVDSTSFLRSDATDTFSGTNLTFADSSFLRLGTGGDLRLFHNGTNSFIDQIGTGDLYIRNTTNDEDIVIQTDDGSGSTATYFLADGSTGESILYHYGTKKFATKSTGIEVTGLTDTDTLNVSGVSTFQSHVHLGDNDELRFGAGDDFKIYHDPNDARLENSNGDVKFKNTGSYFFFDEDGGETLASFINDGAVNLYYGGNKKFETTSTGIHVDANTTLGGTAGDSQDIAIFETDNGNASKLKITENRFANGSNWTTAYTRIQKQIDSSNMGYIQFNGSGLNYGIEIGNATDGEKYATFARNAAATLYHDGVGKFNTTSTGANVTGTLLATSLSTGAAGTGINISTNTITGPSTLTIDPAAIGDNTGTVVIAGNLQIDGTTTTVNSTTMTVDDKNLELGTGAANDAAADGGGITIASGDGNKTFQFEATGDNLGSSENLNLANTKEYKIDNTSVLSATTLGSGVTASSLTSVGTLTSLSVSGDLSIADKIVHIGDTNTAIRFPLNDTFTVETAGSERLRITSDGSVGIGTDNPTTLLDIRSTNAIESNFLTLRADRNGANTEVGILFKDRNVVAGIQTAARINSLREGSSGSFSLVFSTSASSADATEKLRITSGGLVGIGITDPQERLHVARNVMVTGNTPQIRLNANDSDASDNDRTMLGQATGNGNFVTTAVDNDTVLRGTATGNLLFGVGTAEKLRITSDGSVGIGTDNPSRILHVSSSNDQYIRVTSTNSAKAGIEFGDSADEGRANIVYENSDDSMFFTVDGSEKVRITSDGQVGIGTDNPSRKLVVQDSGNTFLSIKAGTSDDVGLIFGDTDSDARGLIRYANNGDSLRFWTAGSEQVRINSGGSVGIGTDDPNTLLHLHSTNPTLRLTDSNQSADNKSWNITAGQTQLLRIQAINDSNTGGGKLFDFYRSGTQVEKFLGRSGTEYWFEINNTSKKVGIGTENPATTLEVAGTGSPTIRVTDLDGTDQFGQILSNNGTFVIESRNDTSTGRIMFRGRDGSGTVEYGRFDSNGDLGIGTDNPASPLHIGQSTDNSVTAGITLKNNPSIGAQRFTLYNEEDVGTHYNSNDGGSARAHIFETGESEKVRISSNGAVGINTTADTRQLEIYNSSHATAAIKGDTQSSLFFIDSGDSNIGQISYIHADNYMYFRVNDAERLRIGSAGQIGLGGANYGTSGQVLTSNGASSAPTWQTVSGGISNIVEDTTPQLGGDLDLNGNGITGNGNVNLAGIVTVTGNVDLTGGVNLTGILTATSFSGSAANLTGTTGASAATYGDASNVAQIVVDANGRITGITEVAISGGGGATDKIEEGNTSAEVIDTGSDGRFVVTTEGTEKLRVTPAGNVGINSTAPVSALDVGIGTITTKGSVDLRASDSNTQKFSMLYNETTDSLDFVYTA